jgi:IS605 OrfB family transposase
LSQITLQTRIEDPSGVFDAFSELMKRVERRIHAELLSGRKWTGDLAVSLYAEFGISAKLMESAYAARQAKVKSAQELAKLHAQELMQKIESKRREIVRKTARISTKRKSAGQAAATILKVQAKLEKLRSVLDGAAAAKKPMALQRYKSMLGVLHAERQKLVDAHAEIKRLYRDLHQHKRLVEHLETKLASARNRIDVPSICFGTRKLFKAQHHLKENGFASHAEWREAWRRARTATFMIEGAAVAASGNQFARLTLRTDGLFDLHLRLPKALKAFAMESFRVAGRDIHSVKFEGLKFPHQTEELAGALTREIPVSVRFHRDGSGWRIMPTFKAEVSEAKQDFSCGSIGVDLNAGFVSVARADRHGNVVEAFDIPMVTYGRSQDQSEDMVKKVAAQISGYACGHDVPIVSERLDFDRKKGALKGEDPRYARMLSSFVYSSFDAALSSAAARRAVFHAHVNPAYTSIIGRVKFARRYGLSVHQSAALAIARRAMELGEQPPRSFKETRSVGVSLNDAHHVTLGLPVRKDPAVGKDGGERHVWSDWNEVVKALRDAHAARRPSGRRAKGPKPRPVMGRNDLHSMVCRSRRAVPEQLHPVAGSAG